VKPYIKTLYLLLIFFPKYEVIKGSIKELRKEHNMTVKKVIRPKAKGKINILIKTLIKECFDSQHSYISLKYINSLHLSQQFSIQQPFKI
jgi:hypothetical protein